MYNAIYIALKDLKKVVATNVEDIRRQAIVVLSDGEDTSSLLPFEEVLDLAKRSETAIYAIGLRSSEGVRRDARLQGSGVRPAAAGAGNRRPRVLPERRSPSSPAIYKQISDELSSQYTVGYTLAAIRSATAPGAASSSASTAPNADGAHQAGLLRRRPSARTP